MSGQWSGSASDVDAVTSDENGIATIRSDRTREESGALTLTVDGVSKDGWTYDPNANVESSEQIDF